MGDTGGIYRVLKRAVSVMFYKAPKTGERKGRARCIVIVRRIDRAQVRVGLQKEFTLVRVVRINRMKCTLLARDGSVLAQAD